MCAGIIVVHPGRTLLAAVHKIVFEPVLSFRCYDNVTVGCYWVSIKQKAEISLVASLRRYVRRARASLNRRDRRGLRPVVDVAVGQA